MAQKEITFEKIDILINKIRKEPTVNSIFYFTRILKRCLGGADNNDDENQPDQEFIIEDSEIFDIVLKFGLSEFPILLKRICLQHQRKVISQLKKQQGITEAELKQLEDVEQKEIIKHVKSKKVEIILRVFVFNFYKFYSQLHEDDMILFVLKRLPEISDLMYLFPNLVRKTIKHTTEVWATADILPIKLHAFIGLRKFALNMEKKEVEQLFRKTYVAFVKNVKIVNWRNYELVIFMINCFNELLSIDFDAAYITAFSYLRQIAVALKEGLQHKEKDAERKLYNWEILNSLKVWVNVICKNEQLSQLIYPLVELIQGLINYHRENEYIPMHLHLIRLLIDIQEKSGLFIPVMFYIKQFLNANLFEKKLVKSSHLKTYDFILNIKIEKKYAKSAVMWNEVFKQLLDLSVVSLSKYSLNPEFPEMTYNYVKFLTRLGKKLKFIIYKMQIKETINLLKKNADSVLESRIKSNLAPNKVALMNANKQELMKKSALIDASKKITEEREAKIKQKISAEKEQFYDHKDKKRRGHDEDSEGEEEEDEDGDDDEDQDQQNDDESYDFDQDLSNKGSDGEDDEDSIDKQNYDLDEMDYSGDPDEYNSEDFEEREDEEEEEQEVEYEEEEEMEEESE